jgi:lincosamide nucleotidyltransferase A/C/D/E
MRSTQVADLFRSFAAADISAWAGGGWAVDALVGHETRAHADLDLAVDAGDLPKLQALLAEQGFVATVDWMPSRLELTAPDGRILDIHPVVFSADGGGRQAGLNGESFFYAADGFTTGLIDGSPIPCLSIDQQLRFRQGYDHRPEDIHDLALLNRLRGAR